MQVCILGGFTYESKECQDVEGSQDGSIDANFGSDEREGPWRGETPAHGIQGLIPAGKEKQLSAIAGRGLFEQTLFN